MESGMLADVIWSPRAAMFFSATQAGVGAVIHALLPSLGVLRGLALGNHHGNREFDVVSLRLFRDHALDTRQKLVGRNPGPLLCNLHAGSKLLLVDRLPLARNNKVADGVVPGRNNRGKCLGLPARALMCTWGSFCAGNTESYRSSRGVAAVCADNLKSSGDDNSLVNFLANSRRKGTVDGFSGNGCAASNWNFHRHVASSLHPLRIRPNQGIRVKTVGGLETRRGRLVNRRAKFHSLRFSKRVTHPAVSFAGNLHSVHKRDFGGLYPGTNIDKGLLYKICLHKAFTALPLNRS